MIFAGIAAVLVIISVKSKMSNNYLRTEEAKIIQSPLAEAINDLVGVSGGIYLALLMATEFIGLDGDWRVYLDGYAFNALALLAIFLSLMQPISVFLCRKIFRR